jgi:D-tyrosyl-tRNA(Tyr) deacylase
LREAVNREARFVRTVVQRVSHGKVSVAGELVAEIGHGLVILVGVGKGDGEAQADWLAEKIANLRIFEDEAGKMNRSVCELGGSALVVSQFTLYADVQKGRRPSFVDAALPDQAQPLVGYFGRRLVFHGVPVKTGTFGAHMLVEIDNDGPVTIVLERSPLPAPRSAP